VSRGRSAIRALNLSHEHVNHSAGDYTPFPQCCSEIVKQWQVLKRNDCAGSNVTLSSSHPKELVCSRRGTRASQLPRTRRNLGPAPPQSLPPTIPLFFCFAILTGTIAGKNLVPASYVNNWTVNWGNQPRTPLNTADHALYNRPCTPVGTDSLYSRFLAPGKAQQAGLSVSRGPLVLLIAFDMGSFE
jgi:hypothetical protein